jgi:CheY-like chemotaxis protein/anti-sigma regulatory factor (Ser/Thr protein kinase)
VVRCDPVLLERVVRNLASNAVRYTDSGGVVLAARSRGARLSIEIWDSGRGIPLDQQDRVFQEFYQLHNPERDRGKGLGLGLAIVRRLTRLLGCTLTLRSVPGRGSVFKISVERAPGEIAAPVDAAQTRAAPTPLSKRGGHIVVVDDEVAVRVAMYSLLTSWGHEVLVGANAEEIIALWNAAVKAPGLIISDYRLRGAETGADAIATLRAYFDAPIAAMLVTGDTAPDRLREAQASGFLLLHKPVSNGRLRAAVGNLLAQGATARPD